MTLRQGMRGGAVLALQRQLEAAGYSLAVDGVYGPETADTVAEYQADHGLRDDGVYGPNTAAALAGELYWYTVPAIPDRDGYDSLTVRSDVGPDLADLHRDLVCVGNGLTSSGGRRGLGARVNATRSATSLHYLGLAIDLHVGSAMRDPHNDWYVVVRDGEYWRVYSRVGEPTNAPDLPLFEGKLEGYRADHTTVEVDGVFVDVTEALARIGWERIRPRRSFFTRNRYGAAEWWHFQCESAIPDGATFGELLDAMYPREQWINTPPGRYADAVWQADFF